MIQKRSMPFTDGPSKLGILYSLLRRPRGEEGSAKVRFTIGGQIFEAVVKAAGTVDATHDEWELAGVAYPLGSKMCHMRFEADLSTRTRTGLITLT